LVGEIRTADQEDERGQLTPSSHFRFVEEDEQVDPRKVYSEEDLAEKRREAGLRDQRSAIEKALYALDPEDDSHWTRMGDPSLQVVHKLVDFDVSRAKLREVMPGFDRETARGQKPKA